MKLKKGDTSMIASIKQNPVRTALIGLLGVSFVILVHEFGHFIACKLFGVGTPIFSIGFGPTLASIKLGTTTFQLALLPLGGYVEISPTDLAALPYAPTILIMLAGIIFNLLFTYGIFLYLSTKYSPNEACIANNGGWRCWFGIPTRIQAILKAFLTEEGQTGLIGPIGIIRMIGHSAKLGIDFYLFVLALISINIAFFNLLPIPFFDGGKIVFYTIEKLAGPISGAAVNYVYLLFFVLLLAMTIFVSLRDVVGIRRK